MFLQGATQAGAEPAAQAGVWPAEAVRDTVAEIVRQEGFVRAPESIASRLWRLFLDWFSKFADLFGEWQYGRVVAIALFALLAILIIARIVVAMRAQDAAAAVDVAGRRRRSAADAWTSAQELAARGAFTDAAHALLAALIDAFAARGEVRVHASKTAGDYARELVRSRSRSSSAFDTFRRRYDTVIYGAGGCSADQYAVMLSDARTLLGHIEVA
ncbi:MAG TPA: DUF4129 domain-containing protein [Gemmatimonadaceae bacterium]|nr:DUF4129 domain-containing protein [Gemmatimonadaceae bacterium]